MPFSRARLSNLRLRVVVHRRREISAFMAPAKPLGDRGEGADARISEHPKMLVNARLSGRVQRFVCRGQVVPVGYTRIVGVALNGASAEPAPLALSGRAQELSDRASPAAAPPSRSPEAVEGTAEGKRESGQREAERKRQAVR